MLWGVKWRSENKLDGKREFNLWHNGIPIMFKTRREAREFIFINYGYIKDRPDLRKEPHGWKMPIPIKVEVIDK